MNSVEDEANLNINIAGQHNENCSKTVLQQVHEYTENSTLHGVYYIGDQSRHWIERYQL